MMRYIDISEKGEPDVATLKRSPVNIAHLGAIFHPRSVAFIGASGQFGCWVSRIFFTTILG